MNNKRFWWSAITVFAFIFLFEWLFHGQVLSGLYESTANLWRPEAEMSQYFWWLVAGQFVTALFFTYIFTKGYENKGVGEGIRYGLLIGCIFAGPNLIMYAVQPYPLVLAFWWIGGALVEFMAAGALLSKVYEWVGSSTASATA